ncbi:MAG: PaaI family thioesterase [Desulfovermiculus sp.]
MTQSNTQRQPVPNMDTTCFACGSDNRCGLHMQFFTDGEKLYSTVIPPPHLSGWENLLHGGIISTMLDEIMVWTAMHLLQKVILTKSIQVEYLRPIQVNSELEIQGWVEKHDERTAWIQGVILDAKDREMARSRGEMALFAPDSKVLQRILPQNITEKARQRFQGR